MLLQILHLINLIIIIALRDTFVFRAS